MLQYYHSSLVSVLFPWIPTLLLSYYRVKVHNMLVPWQVIPPGEGECSIPLPSLVSVKHYEVRSRAIFSGPCLRSQDIYIIYY